MQHKYEKENIMEQEELTDNETNAGNSAKDRVADMKAIETEGNSGEGGDRNPIDYDNADCEEELQGDTIIANTGEVDISSTEAEESLSSSNNANSNQPKQDPRFDEKQCH